MKHRIAIFDEESSFVKALAEYLNERYEESLEAIAFDDFDKLLLYLEQKKCQMCYIAKSKLDAYQMEKILNSNIPIHSFSTNKQEEGIFQYQSIDRLVAEMVDAFFAIYPEKIKKHKKNNNMKKIEYIGFYSPQRSILQSMISFSLGKRIANEKKTLWISFEAFSPLYALLSSTGGYDLSDVIFCMQDENKQIKMKTMMKETEGLYYFLPAVSYIDIKETPQSVWEKLIESIIAYTDIECIIIDFFEIMNGCMYLMQECDLILTGYENNFLAEEKRDSFYYLLQKLNLNNIEEKIVEYEIMQNKQIDHITGFLTSRQLYDLTESLYKSREKRIEAIADGR